MKETPNIRYCRTDFVHQKGNKTSIGRTDHSSSFTAAFDSCDLSHRSTASTLIHRSQFEPDCHNDKSIDET